MSASNPRIFKNFDQLVRCPDIDVYDCLSFAERMNLWIGSIAIHVDTEKHTEPPEEVLKTFSLVSRINSDKLYSIGKNIAERRYPAASNSWMKYEKHINYPTPISMDSTTGKEDIRTICLALFAHYEEAGRAPRMIKTGDVVFPSFLYGQDGKIPRGITNVGVVINVRGNTDALVLWRVGSSTYCGSCRLTDLIRVNYKFTKGEWDKLWDDFEYNDNWNKGNCTPTNGLLLDSEVKKPVAKKKEPDTRAVYRHYWELNGKVLKIGDEVILFDKHILKVQKHCFEDTTTLDGKAMWWAKWCANILDVDFDTMFFPIAEKLGFYAWKDHPAELLRYQWQYTTLNNATAWALWLLAISDKYFLHHSRKAGVKDLLGHHTHVIPNGKGMTLGTGTHAMMPSLIEPAIQPSHPNNCFLKHPLSGRWVAEYDSLLPAFRHMVEYQAAQAFLNNQNTNTHVIQSESTGTDPGRQNSQAHRKPGQETQTQDGGGYTSDRRRLGGSQGKTRSGQVSGCEHTAKHRQLRIVNTGEDPNSESGSSRVRTGAEDPAGRVFDPISSRRRYNRPSWSITDEAFTCSECGEESMFCESVTPGYKESREHYRCVNDDCGHTDSFP